jgi:hypothetical protein
VDLSATHFSEIRCANLPVEYTLEMEDDFDLKSDAVRRSLAETIAWCKNQQIISAVEESDEAKHQRKLAEQAGELIQRAYAERGKFWNRVLRRKYTNSRLWQRGMELYSRADLTFAPLKDQLRSPAISPNGSVSDAQSQEKRVEVVRSVIAKRAEVLLLTEHPTDLNAGKLLLYSPDENLADGAARYASRGFFDDDNVPPWDTWVAFSDDTLLTWVPPQLLELAQRGIDVNPECCIRWAS